MRSQGFQKSPTKDKYVNNCKKYKAFNGYHNNNRNANTAHYNFNRGYNPQSSNRQQNYGNTELRSGPFNISRYSMPHTSTHGKNNQNYRYRTFRNSQERIYVANEGEQALSRLW